MAVYITGDTHGYYQLLMDRLEANNYHLTKEDILIIMGDFGFVWSFAENIDAFKKLSNESFTVAFIDGNHEEFPLINSFPVSEWNGGKVHRIGISENIIHLMRGQCFNIEGMSFFTMGGAYSIDKDTLPRKEGVDWFPEELPNNEEYRTASATLEKHNYKFDYILTHTVPDAALYELGFGPDYHDAELTGFLQWVYTHSEFKKWFAGHFHDERELLNGNLKILYNDVIKLN